MDGHTAAQALQAELTQKHDQSISYTDVLSAAMYPKVFDEYRCGPCALCPVPQLARRDGSPPTCPVIIHSSGSSCQV